MILDSTGIPHTGFTTKEQVIVNVELKVLGSLELKSTAFKIPWFTILSCKVIMY